MTTLKPLPSMQTRLLLLIITDPNGETPLKSLAWAVGLRQATVANECRHLIEEGLIFGSGRPMVYWPKCEFIPANKLGAKSS